MLPGMTAAPTATRDRILDAAEALVLQHGFAATTVDAVLAAAGSSKGAFFHHFPSKAELGQALVARYADMDAATLERLMERAETLTDDPAAQLVAFLGAFEDELDDLAGAQPGCLFVSFIYESDLGGSGTEEIVRESILLWRRRLLAKLEAAAATRPSLADADLEALADAAFSAFQGGFLLARAMDDPGLLRRQVAHLRRYVELLLA
jgi:TetR/AcrR family transcriptional repressor of nem operon